MPFNSRDLWIILKAQDQASRALNSYSRAVRDAGNATRLAQLEVQRNALISQQTRMKEVGATAEELAAVKRHISAIDQETNAIRSSEKMLAIRRAELAKLGATMNSVSQTANVMGFAISAAGVGALIGFKKAVDAAVEYERQVRLTATQIDNFGGNLKEISDIGLKVARNIAVPFEQIQTALFDIFSSLEVSVPQAEVLLNQFSKAAVAGQTSIEAASRGTIGILNAFRIPLSQVNHVLDIQFQLVQEGIGTYEEWVAKIGKVSPSAARAGQSLETMAAALAESTRLGVASAQSSTAVTRAFDAFPNPRAVQALKKLGIAATDAKGDFRPFLDVMFEFRAVLDKIPGKQKKTEALLDVFKGAGGTIEARKFLNNLLLIHGSLEEFQIILNEMKNGTGGFEKAYAMMADTTAAKSQLMSNRWKVVQQTIGDALIPSFLKVVTFLSNLAEKFNNLPPKTKTLITNMLLLAAAGTTLVGGLLLVLSAVAAVGAAFVVAGSAMVTTLGIIVGGGAVLAAMTSSLYLLWQRSNNFRSAVLNLKMDLIKLWNESLKPLALGIKDSFERNVIPALEKFYKLIDEEVIPTVNTISQIVRNNFTPAFKEVTVWVREKLGGALNFIG